MSFKLDLRDEQAVTRKGSGSKGRNATTCKTAHPEGCVIPTKTLLATAQKSKQGPGRPEGLTGATGLADHSQDFCLYFKGNGNRIKS